MGSTRSEDGQESAVADAPPIDPRRRARPPREVVVYCQGEED